MASINYCQYPYAMSHKSPLSLPIELTVHLFAPLPLCSADVSARRSTSYAQTQSSLGNLSNHPYPYPTLTRSAPASFIVTLTQPLPGTPTPVGIGMGVGMGMGNMMTNMFNNQNTNQNQNNGVVPPPPPRVQFHVVVNGAQAGPFTLQQLQLMASSGQLTKTSLVWKAGMPNWLAADTQAELSTLFNNVPPPI